MQDRRPKKSPPTQVPKRGLRVENVVTCWQFDSGSRAEVTTTGNKCQRDYIVPRAWRQGVCPRRNRSKPGLEMTRARTKPECRSSRFGLGRVMSMVEIESARIETEDARTVTAGPPGPHRSKNPDLDNDTMSYRVAVGSGTSADAQDKHGRIHRNRHGEKQPR